MRAILPGRPQSKPQALCTALWDDLRLIAYLSGNAVVILGGPKEILQTIYVDEVSSLEAITIEEASGKIAFCGDQHLYIYQPLGRDEGVLKWSQCHDITIQDTGVATLSWASSEELLVGGAYLCLWNVAETVEPSMIWQEKLANPVRFACISHDGGLIASCGSHDRLVKIWRRLSYEVDSTRFDVSYLPHPTAVTNIHWRKPWHSEQNLDNLLYTFCADDRIRIWTHSDPHSKAVMQPVAEIDMKTSIQPRTPVDGSSGLRRFGFVLDSRDFSRATEKAVQRSTTQAVEHAMEHLIEVASRSPEICVVLDDHGHISAWGIENAGCKNRLPSTIFNVVHVRGMGITLANASNPTEDYVQFCTFAGGDSDSSLTILAHYFNGRIDWYDTQIAEVFDPAPRQQRSRMISSWTGHDALINRLVADHQSEIMTSYTEQGQMILWRQGKLSHGPVLQLIGSQKLSTSVGSLCHTFCLARGKFAVTFDSDTVSLWRIRPTTFEKIASTKVLSRMKAVHVRLLAQSVANRTKMNIVSINADMTTTLWEIYVPSPDKNQQNGNHAPIRKVCDFAPGSLKASAIAVSVPGPTSSHDSQNASSPAERASFVSVDMDSTIQRLSVKLAADTDTATLGIMSAVKVCIRNPSAIAANGSGNLAVIESSKTTLSIWDVVDGQVEFEQHFDENDTIEKLSWVFTPHGKSLLAVGCPHKILILGQMPFRSHATTTGWAKLYEIRIRDFATHSLGDLCWLRQGNLAIGVGNQIFVYEQKIKVGDKLAKQLRLQERSASSMEFFELVDRLNASLPIFHPDLLLQLILLGNFSLIHRILLTLHEALKFASPGEELPSLLNIPIEAFITVNRDELSVGQRKIRHVYSHSISNKDDGTKDTLTATIAELLQENLEKMELWQISVQEQLSLSSVAGVLSNIEEHRQSVDEHAFRFLHSFTLRNRPLIEAGAITAWRENVFASHSVSQEILVDVVSRFFKGNLTWENARKSGIFLWLSDHEAVRAQMEVVARNEYTKHEDRNPVDCSLYYLALGKKGVLQGLWRMCVGNREKENTVKLLANNFSEARWKTTALKNAYVLLSKRRFEYAAAFFLLGGSLKDAVNVCVHQIGQIELGIAIARVHEGNDGPVLKQLLTETVLPLAADTGNRWLASWAFEMLGKHDQAVQALVRPLHSLVPGAKSDLPDVTIGSKASMSFQANEPSLVVLYKHLRRRLVKANMWTEVIAPKEEWDFVMRCVRQYMRMGCDVLALDLVRNWNFVECSPPAIDRKSDIVVQKRDKNISDEKISVASMKAKAEQQSKGKQPPPTQFQEPSASSLLDSFGF